ncbi:hypothetical protein C8Q74DRAFT_993361 [Fomes fomentarius]|nr:hypothetical protein C8Q74DRAFT_993361 [Fomes fomentarius]
MRTQHWAHPVDRTRLTSAYDEPDSPFSLLLSGTLTYIYLYLSVLLRPSASVCTVRADLHPRSSSRICAERRWKVGIAQVGPCLGYPGWRCGRMLGFQIRLGKLSSMTSSLWSCQPPPEDIFVPNDSLSLSSLVLPLHHCSVLRSQCCLVTALFYCVLCYLAFDTRLYLLTAFTPSPCSWRTALAAA